MATTPELTTAATLRSRFSTASQDAKERYRVMARDIYTDSIPQLNEHAQKMIEKLDMELPDDALCRSISYIISRHISKDPEIQRKLQEPKHQALLRSALCDHFLSSLASAGYRAMVSDMQFSSGPEGPLRLKSLRLVL